MLYSLVCEFVFLFVIFNIVLEIEMFFNLIFYVVVGLFEFGWEVGVELVVVGVDVGLDCVCVKVFKLEWLFLSVFRWNFVLFKWMLLILSCLLSSGIIEILIFIFLILNRFGLVKFCGFFSLVLFNLKLIDGKNC